uniref:DUF4939 domain-containing protein n=1 Tax=Electrophorus electricus TaxID=8005 RepID=A0A4W4E6F8_ELEEL
MDNKEVRQCVSHLTMSPQSPVTSPAAPPVPEGIRCLIATPEAYGGDLESCEGFMVQCVPPLPDHTKVSFVISRLTGKARAWGIALVANSSPLMNNYPCFIHELKVSAEKDDF